MAGVKSSEGIHLTARQREVLGGIARGLTASEIASELQISARTVRMHSDVLRTKLKVERWRQVPQAYRSATGADPLGDGHT